MSDLFQLIKDYLEQFNPCDLRELDNYSTVEEIINSLNAHRIFWLMDYVPEFVQYRKDFLNIAFKYFEEYRIQKSLAYSRFLQANKIDNDATSKDKHYQEYCLSEQNLHESYVNKVRELFKPIALKIIKEKFLY